MEGADSEREAYRKIISRAKRARERAAESLRRSRASRRKQGGAPNQTPPKPRMFRRED